MQAVAVELVTRGHSGRSATRAAGVVRSSFIRRIKPSPPTDRAIRRLLLTDAVGKIHVDSILVNIATRLLAGIVFCFFFLVSLS